MLPSLQKKTHKNHKYLTSDLDLVLQKCCIHLALKENQKYLLALIFNHLQENLLFIGHSALFRHKGYH